MFLQNFFQHTYYVLWRFKERKRKQFSNTWFASKFRSQQVVTWKATEWVHHMSEKIEYNRWDRHYWHTWCALCNLIQLKADPSMKVWSRVINVQLSSRRRFFPNLLLLSPLSDLPLMPWGTKVARAISQLLPVSLFVSFVFVSGSPSSLCSAYCEKNLRHASTLNHMRHMWIFISLFFFLFVRGDFKTFFWTEMRKNGNKFQVFELMCFRCVFFSSFWPLRRNDTQAQQIDFHGPPEGGLGRCHTIGSTLQLLKIEVYES